MTVRTWYFIVVVGVLLTVDLGTIPNPVSRARSYIKRAARAERGSKQHLSTLAGKQPANIGVGNRSYAPVEPALKLNLATLKVQPWIQHMPAAVTGSTSSISSTMRIPRIIHQYYLAGHDRMLQDAMQPASPFRKEWWSSCKTYHPGWTYVLWDATSCEALIRQHFPHFWDTWQLLRNVPNVANTVTSDAIRPMILYMFGGVYLDTDVECFTDMTPWLHGTDIVLQAERRDLLVGSQMASVAQHNFWLTYLEVMQQHIATGRMAPWWTTGPGALTKAFKNAVGVGGALEGCFSLLDGSSAVVYGYKQWFYACEWTDKACQEQIVRDDANMPFTAQQTVQTAKAAPPSKLPIMLNQTALAGVHHYSGSWMPQPHKAAAAVAKLTTPGIMAFLNDTGTRPFAEHRCQQLVILGAGTNYTASSAVPTRTLASNATVLALGRIPVPVCWEAITAANATGNCTVLFVTDHPTANMSTAASQQLPASVLAAAGCHVTVVSPFTAHASRETQTPLKETRAVVGVYDDPFADPPLYTLGMLVATLSRANRPVTLLVLDLGQGGSRVAQSVSSSSALIHSLYTSNADALRSVNQLVVTMPLTQPDEASHTVHTMYQHLFKEQGYVGFCAMQDNASKARVLGFLRPSRM